VRHALSGLNDDRSKAKAATRFLVDKMIVGVVYIGENTRRVRVVDGAVPCPPGWVGLGLG
jgi:hypothetical protein